MPCRIFNEVQEAFEGKSRDDFSFDRLFAGLELIITKGINKQLLIYVIYLQGKK
jgi:hypothetical protein